VNLWRLELLRMVRGRRWIALVAVHVFFGFLGPLTAAYMDELVARFGGGAQVSLPDPTAADGLAQFTSNAQQLGLLVVVVVAAAALAFDAKPEMGVFLRTRTRSTWQIIAPRYAVATASAVGAFCLGALAAWYETAVLLGGLPPGAMGVGLLLYALYLAFAVAVTAVATTLARTVLPAVVLAVALLAVLPLAGVVAPVRPWLPSTLVGALDELVRGASVADFARGAAGAAAATSAALALAVWRATRREL
jgi:ABC-2 type transport system permease protein